VQACAALRTVWRKLLTALGAPDAPRALVHAVCSSRTLSERDPWVNMLRVTNADLADSGRGCLVTPNAFDQALAELAQGRRVARTPAWCCAKRANWGKWPTPPADPSIETLTDQLARKAWQRFQELEREGGIAAALRAARWPEVRSSLDRTAGGDREGARLDLGVSEFANLDEKLPQPAPKPAAASGLRGPIATRQSSRSFAGVPNRDRPRQQRLW